MTNRRLGMKDDKVLSCLGMILVLVIAVVGGAIIEGLVLVTLWGWFAIPVFDVPVLSIPYAIGIALLVGLLTHQPRDTNNKSKETLEVVGETLGNSIFSPLVVLLFGYVVHLFV